MTPGRREIEGRSLRWDQAWADAAYADGLWVRETLADALARAAADAPARVLVVDGDTRLDAATLNGHAVALAQTLMARFPRGSVISFMLPNWHEAAIIYLGATLAGMVVNPVMPSLRDRDLLFILKDVGSRMIFVPADLRGFDYRAMMDRLTGEFDGTPPETVVLRGDAGGHTAFAALFCAIAPQPLPTLEPDAVRMILYTSGTTGSPKGVLHSHNSIHALIRQLGRHWLVAPGDRFLVPSPVAHIGGSIYAFEMPLLLGTTAILLDRWEPDRAVAILAAARCSHMAGATPFLEGVVVAARNAGTRLPDLKVFICGGASVPPSLIRSAADYFEQAVVTRVYGSTEVPVTTVGTIDRGDVAHAADTDGAPGIAEVRLVKDETTVGQSEICARGPQMLVGYLHPEDEDKVFDADGFYRTGDLAQQIDGRFLVVTGRSKDIIIRKGENISPKEIEDILVDHPDISEVAIVGVPDARSGERACAVIVPRNRLGPDLASLRAFLNAQGVAVFKVPEQIEIRNALPKNDAGKVLKHVLRTELQRSEG